MKEKFILGIALFVTGTLLFGMMHAAIALYIPNMVNWSDTSGLFQSALSQTSGWLVYILSIILMIVGLILLVVHYKPHWNALMDKEIPVDSRKKLLLNQEITWENIEHSGSENLQLIRKGFSVFANGTVRVKSVDGPYQLTYQLELDNQWRTKKVDLTIGDRNLTIWSNGEGAWRSKTGPLPELDSAIDVDIEATPFSNSLPINRNDWIPNQTREFDMVYIAVPFLEYTKLKQSYTYKGTDGPYRVFHYKCRDYETIITVDSEGLVVDYPKVFERRY